VTKTRIARNLERIRGDVAEACARAGRSPGAVSIVAVTKAVDFDAVRTLLDVGLTDLGENRVQQLAQRAEMVGAYLQRRRNGLPAPLRWHMIGHLQRNKVRHVLDVADVIHSVDSLRLAEELNTRAERAGRKVDIFLQVNCSQEPQKSGVAVGAATHLAELICTLKSVRLLGLMTMAPLTDDPEQARPSFARLRELYEEMRRDKIGGDALRHLSMGMSQDYTVAVEEGATVLRIGTALFA
jgi:hypothetical protein